MASLTSVSNGYPKYSLRNLWVLFALSVATAIVVLVTHPGQGKVTVEITDERIPMQVGEWQGRRYEMGALVYQALRPDAIVSRIYIDPKGRQIDFVLLAGSHSEAFHNPHLCFPDQGWKIQNDRQVELRIPGVDKSFNARLMQVDNNGRKATVVYWYRSPLGSTGSAAVARISTYIARLLGMQRQQTFFMRFIVPSSGNEDNDLDVVREFAGQMLSALKQSLPEVI
ncbi:MAG: exosortase C-terminal domain/associated protein EpsI [Armatimonadota bacterium]